MEFKKVLEYWRMFWKYKRSPQERVKWDPIINLSMLGFLALTTNEQ